MAVQVNVSVLKNNVKKCINLLLWSDGRKYISYISWVFMGTATPGICTSS